MLKFGKKAVFKCTMAKFILSITILLVNAFQVMAVSLMQGQGATLHFFYPCDSTEVTLQHSHRVPFYRLTDGSSLALPDDQVHRFKVQNRIENGNCSLDLTISNLMGSDAGTYLSTIYKEGQLHDDYTTRVGLQLDYPPGKASCDVSEGKGGDWVSIDCTANVGSVSGKIECYQDGVWMPPSTHLTETDTLLKQTIFIRKSKPVFCCSSTLIEYKERCECNDTALYLDDASSSDPCTSISTKRSITSTYRTPDLIEISQSFKSSDYPLSSYTRSKNANRMNKDNWKAIITYLILATALVIMITLYAILLYKWRQKRNNIYNSNDESQDPSLSRQFHDDDAQERVTEKLIQFKKPHVHVPYCHQSLKEFTAHDYKIPKDCMRKYQSLSNKIITFKTFEGKMNSTSSGGIAMEDFVS